MADRSARRNVSEGTPETDAEGRSEAAENAVPNYNPWVSFYGFLHRFVRRHVVVFGGTGVVGALVLVRQLYALVSGPPRWPVLPSWMVGVGALLLAFAVGYFSVKDASSCRECGAAFSKERVASRPVHESHGSRERDRTYVRETFECQECGNRTTEPYSYPDREYPRS